MDVKFTFIPTQSFYFPLIELKCVQIDVYHLRNIFIEVENSLQIVLRYNFFYPYF
jgi:hypothetical protein